MQSIDIVSGKWLFLGRIEDDAGDVKVFSVSQCLIDPSFYHSRIQNIARVTHSHDLTNTILETDSIRLLVLAYAFLSVRGQRGALIRALLFGNTFSPVNMRSGLHR